MTTNEIEQLELLADIDELVAHLSHWADTESVWEPMCRSQAMVRRLLARIEALRVRIDTPLVVALFGGTGTGKSSLANALLGRECSRAGRERPTTTQPVLIVHSETDIETLGFALDDLEIVRNPAPILREIVLIDCPDPDTSEAETSNSNLERLRRLVPHCDVLIYTTTQQKYCSARVVEELGQAATGCRLLFVQTHADLDDDIRDDWRSRLAEHYTVHQMFFVDSIRALREQASAEALSADFGRLQGLLATHLAASRRMRIRRANLIDLIDTGLQHCDEQLSEAWPAVEALESELRTQRDRLLSRMSNRFREELLLSRQLWERRLLTAVTESWGFSPFASMLRLYNGLGSLIASLSLFRARSSAQVALIGAFQGTRWLSARRKDKEAETHLRRASSLGLEDAALREAQLVISGYVRDAQVAPELAENTTLDVLRDEAVKVEDQFLGSAASRIDSLIDETARKCSGRITRLVYEVLFSLYVIFVLFRIGENFFYGTFLKPFLGKPPDPMLSIDFYIPAIVFFVLWSGLLGMLFTGRLRRGLQVRIERLADELAATKLAQGLFPGLERACRQMRQQRDALKTMHSQTIRLRQRLAAAPELGTPFDAVTVPAPVSDST